MDVLQKPEIVVAILAVQPERRTAGQSELLLEPAAAVGRGGGPKLCGGQRHKRAVTTTADLDTADAHLADGRFCCRNSWWAA